MVTEGERKFENFLESAQRVLSLAQEEAERFHHGYIGTEHILLGLLRETEGVAARVLANLKVDPNRVRLAVEFIISRGERPVQNGEFGLTPRAKKVVALAVNEARQMHHTYIGPEHLLIGILREGEGIAAGVLESLGVDLDRVRAETLRILSAQEPLAGELTSHATQRFLAENLAALREQRNKIDQQIEETEEALQKFFPTVEPQ